MPVEPIPCDDGGTGTPGACNCSPSIATSPLCRADGTTILVVVRSPCVTCGTPAPDPTVVGWINPGTGAFTPGAPPADAGPCETALPPCVETLCRQRCDDTTGDGAADTTYTELWCLAADGTATLLLTYQDDPSVPYAPVSPVDCVHGCPEGETLLLCDDSGPFLRRYVFLNGVGTYEDVALDGQTPHLVTGTVGACPNCDPTPPLALVGLCLADGTPIAVVVSRACDGTTTRDGWLNLVTGAYSAGAPPAGVGACTAPGSFELAGILCDTDPATGEVLGLALVQYVYNPDGSLAGVDLVNPADGTPYLLQGELRTCPAGQAQPDNDLVVLCNADPDGTVTRFVRDYRRDENTLITGHTDYLLDGTPYDPPGTVGQCPAEIVDPVPVVPQVFHGEVILCDDLGTFVRKYVQDAAGAITDVVDFTLDGATYFPTGTPRLCQAEPDCPAQSVLEQCRCDDADGDGAADTDYVELLAVDCAGAVTSLGTYLPDYSAPYAPVAPIDCDAGADLGAPPVFGVQAGRVVLDPGESWDGATVPTLQTVTAAASGGTGTITTADGTSTLLDGERAAWSVARDTHARLTGPLTITATDGTVSVTYTREVQL
ncbi:hypothetical protein [Streptomyces sp. NBC_00443]|uniref:hypothetical protein n=1 Tax=Streptomyces sp. NBC_00443 TaxID=2975743 RepID=UPI002E1F05CB